MRLCRLCTAQGGTFHIEDLKHLFIMAVWGQMAVRCHVVIKLAFYNNFKLKELFPNLQLLWVCDSPVSNSQAQTHHPTSLTINLPWI